LPDNSSISKKGNYGRGIAWSDLVLLGRMHRYCTHRRENKFCGMEDILSFLPEDSESCGDFSDIEWESIEHSASDESSEDQNQVENDSPSVSDVDTTSDFMKMGENTFEWSPDPFYCNGQKNLKYKSGFTIDRDLFIFRKILNNSVLDFFFLILLFIQMSMQN
jgi:hypothetical protein